MKMWRLLTKTLNYRYYDNSRSQDDIDEISEIFSDIVKLLKANDHVAVSRIVEMVNRVLETEGGRERIVNTPHMVTSLVDILNSSSDHEAIERTSEILLSLSQCKIGLLSIYQSNGIPVLIRLLSAPLDSLVRLAVVTLHNLLQNQEGSKEAVSKSGGLQKMTILLKHNNDKFLCVVIDCLLILAYRNQRNKFLIFSNNGPAELVHIINTCSSKTLLYTSTKLLKVLSACSSNKRAIIVVGGVHALVKHLNNPSIKLVINCLWTLRNLSDALTKQINSRSFLKILVQLLRSSDKNIRTCTAGILSNITCNNASNKVVVCREIGISALVNALFEAGNSEEILEPVIRTLRHLTREHPEAETAQNDFRLHSGLETIANLLQPPYSWPLIKAIIGLLRNLTLCPNNHESLLSLGIVDILKNILNFIYKDITKKQGHLLCYEAQPTIIDGIKSDIVEGILIVLLNLTRNVNVITLLKDDEIINTFAQLLCNENENIRCIVVDLFCQIVSAPIGISIVEYSGAIPFLCTFLNSENRDLAFKSASLLVKLFTWKPLEYKFLSTELNKIMRKNTSVRWQELLKISDSVTPESGYLVSQSSFNCPSGSISTSKLDFELQSIQNLIFEETEDLDMNIDLDISPQLCFDSTFDAPIFNMHSIP